MRPVHAAGQRHPSPAFVADALCVHSGWHYTSHRPRRGARPEYVLWGHGFWRTWKLPYGSGSEGEGGWDATSNPSYGGGMSFTVGTWNSAGGHARSTADIASASPAEQILRAWIVVSRDRDWHEWPETSRACGLR